MFMDDNRGIGMKRNKNPHNQPQSHVSRNHNSCVVQHKLS